MQVQPVKAYPVQQPVQNVVAVDMNSFMVLNAVQRVSVKQLGALGEAVTCGAYPNSYLISDYNRMYQPMRNNKPYGDPLPYPMFFVKEQAKPGCCNDEFCMRVCCAPQHSSLLKFYHATDPKPQPPMACCGCTLSERPDESSQVPGQPAFMTIERIGLCSKLPNCFVCFDCCRDELRLHNGDIGQAGDAGSLPEDNMIGRGIVPIGGGGCTPTVQLMQRNGPGEENESQIGVVEGPMFFGGCYDLFCDTKFKISRDKGKAGDIGTISKRSPKSCGDFCKQVCSTADTYDMDITPGSATLNPLQKALLIGELIHLDFMFFDRDQSLVKCEKQGSTNTCTVLLCFCYCFGCLLPCKCCLQTSDQN